MNFLKSEEERIEWIVQQNKGLNHAVKELTEANKRLEHTLIAICVLALIYLLLH